jgi:squalene-hopene/tetraprenyl-beta-curcumene cyclase
MKTIAIVARSWLNWHTLTSKPSDAHMSHYAKGNAMLKSFQAIVSSIAVASLFMASSLVLRADEPKYTQAEWQKVVDKAVEFARFRGQAEDGSFSKQNGLGVTAVMATGLASVGVPENDPIVAKALEYLLSFRQTDGGIYQPGSKHANYETCLVVMALTKYNSSGKYNQILNGAERYIKNLQWDETEELKKEDMAYGGAGYGSKSRPDLSNTSFMIDALKSLGRDENDEAIQNALLFVTRCQNLESSENSSPHAALVNDGGFYYTPAAGGESQAGKTENGGLRSYASMTYAGLKSMIFAGVDTDDKRVQAALKFLQKNYSVEINPGMGTSGLFYYYHTMAKALDAVGVKEFETVDGKHDWRNELFQKLASAQNAEGSWVNSDSRWLEGDPNLVSGYSLMTLAFLKPEAR